MASKAGLKKVTKTVRGKKSAVRRSYWVKAKDAVKSTGGFLNRHKGKIATGIALAGAGAYLAHKHRKVNLTTSGSSLKEQGHKRSEDAFKSVKAVEEKHARSPEVVKARRRADAGFRRIKSELRRDNAAATRLERGDTQGAANIMNREAHKNLRKKRNTNLN